MALQGAPGKTVFFFAQGLFIPAIFALLGAYIALHAVFARGLLRPGAPPRAPIFCLNRRTGLARGCAGGFAVRTRCLSAGGSRTGRQALRRGVRRAFAARACRFSVGDSQNGARACVSWTNPASGPSFSAVSSSTPCRLLRGGKQKRPRKKRRSRFRDAGQTYLDVEESGKVEARALNVG